MTLHSSTFTTLLALGLLLAINTSGSTIKTADTSFVNSEGPMLHFIENADGRTAYELSGPEKGPLAILIPGIGDSRHVYRFLLPQLHHAGWRTAVISLRGHDESSTSYRDYSSKAVGQDVVALIDTLGADYVALIGNSIGGPVTVWAAAERPSQIKAVVMIAPFVREVKIGLPKRAMYKLALLPPWGKAMWLGVYKGNYPSQKPADFALYMDNLDTMLSAKGNYKAVRKTIWSSHKPALERLTEVHAPVLAIFGSLDKDFADPADEMRKVADLLDADTLLIEGAGHYPQAEFPEQTGGAIIRFLKEQI